MILQAVSWPLHIPSKVPSAGIFLFSHMFFTITVMIWYFMKNVNQSQNKPRTGLLDPFQFLLLLQILMWIFEFCVKALTRNIHSHIFCWCQWTYETSFDKTVLSHL